jgi:hypothetical protein
VRAFLVHHFNHHSHSLWDHEDVGEYDGGIEKAREALNGLERQGRGDLGISTAFEEVAFAFGFVILGEIPPGCITYQLDI